MRKNIFILLGTFLLLSGILAYCFNAPPAQAASGGLWGEYNFINACKSIGGDEFKSLKIENINFEFNSFDTVLLERTGRLPGTGNCALVKWKGAIYADKMGDYNFRVSKKGHQQYRFKIDDKNVFKNEYQYSSNSTTQADEGESPVTLTAGWHKIFIRTIVYTDSLNSQFQLEWVPPLEEEREILPEDWEILPADKLRPEYWADNTITIPSSGKAKVNYVASGVGAAKAIEDGIDPKIEINMPVKLDKVIKEDVWITWFSRNGIINSDITVTNNITGAKNSVANVKKLKTKYGLGPSYLGMIGRIPKNLIVGDSLGKLSFSFSGLGAGGAKENGIGIIVPYRDQDMPEGKIFLKMYSASATYGVSPTFVFPTTGMDKDNIQPLFFLSDGETKSSTWFRPNYIMMLSGSGSVPDDYTLLKNMPGARMIVPEANSINRKNPNTWYPNYGREGNQFDTISSNYIPNQWISEDTVGTHYIGNEDGKILSISIGKDDSWIAFQYYAGNYEEDGVITGHSGESGPIAGGGLFSTLNSLKKHTLTVTVAGDGSVTSSPAGINCPGNCSGKYFHKTVVTLKAVSDAGSFFSGWSESSCGEAETCAVAVDEDKTVTATFSVILAVDGECGSAVDTSSYSEPTENWCEDDNDLANPPGVEYDSTSGKWKWTCEGSGGGVNVPCETEKRFLHWKEVAP